MEYISFCGLKCLECPAYIAKRTNDNALRTKTAKIWSNAGFIIDADSINCDGCHTENGDLVFHCLKCDVRNCALLKNVTTCADCTDYPCEKLEKLWKDIHAPQARDVLNALH